MNSADTPLGVNLTTGFDSHYRPDDERARSAITTGLIVLDTNVLLHILRYSPTARDELLGVIETLADRCFIPHQVAIEFNRNRVKVVAERIEELGTITTNISEVQKSINSILKNLRDRRTLPESNLATIEESAQTFSKNLQSTAFEITNQYDLDPDKMVGSRDEWTVRLERALAGRVALAPEPEVLDADNDESSRRRQEKLAPGFKDQAGGDYLWWAETLRSPLLPGRALAVVSDDAAKGDWRFETRGIPTGPHPILRQDVLAAGGTDLILLTTSDLLRIIAKIGTSQVSASTIQESQTATEEARKEWTLETYISLLMYLLGEGYEDRVDTIRAASKSGGFISRSSLYAIVGIDEDERSLRQFATPVARISTLLHSMKLTQEKPTAALTAEYDGPGKAVGYSVPAEFADFEGALTSAENIVQKLASPDWKTREPVLAKMRSLVRREILTRWVPDASDSDIESAIEWAIECAELESNVSY